MRRSKEDSKDTVLLKQAVEGIAALSANMAQVTVQLNRVAGPLLTSYFAGSTGVSSRFVNLGTLANPPEMYNIGLADDVGVTAHAAPAGLDLIGRLDPQAGTFPMLAAQARITHSPQPGEIPNSNQLQTGSLRAPARKRRNEEKTDKK